MNESKSKRLEKKKIKALQKQNYYSSQIAMLEEQLAMLENEKQNANEQLVMLKNEKQNTKNNKLARQEKKIQKINARKEKKAKQLAERQAELARIQEEKERIKREREDKRIKAENEKTAKYNKQLREKVSRDFKKRERFLAYGVDPHEKNKTVKTKKPSIFQLLNPANLQAEVHKYGYSYSFKKLIISYILAIAFAIGVSILFKLKVYLILIIILVAILATPSMILTAMKNMYESKRFHDVSNYLELLLYSFRRKPKILDALKDVYVTFQNGESIMGQKVGEAIYYIENAQSAGDFNKEALEIIEKEYDDNSRMKNVHNFLIAVEANGGDYKKPVDLLLNERAMWDERTHSFQKERQTIKRNVTISIVFSLALCYFLLYILNADALANLDIIHNTVVQITSTISIALSVILYVVCTNKLAQSWLQHKKKHNDYQILKNYFNATEFDTKGEVMFSLIFAAILSPILIIAIIKKVKLLIIIFAIVELFILASPFIAKKTAIKTTIKEIEIAFPQWLMELALLLQSDNVQVAISKSLATAPVVLRPELTKLIQEFSKDPNSIRPYQQFLSQFDLPAISSAMGMLYSINEGGKDSIGEQITDLIDKQNKLIDKSERLSNDDSLAGLDVMKMLPMMICIFKSLVDMTILVMSLLQFVNMS